MHLICTMYCCAKIQAEPLPFKMMIVPSGTAVATPPRAQEVEAMEDSSARATLQEFPRAAGAYDRMPFASATAVWTLDTSTDIFLLHSFQVRCSPSNVSPPSGCVIPHVIKNQIR